QIVEPADLDLLLAGAEDTLDRRGDRTFGRLLAQAIRGHELQEELLRRELAVAEGREQVVGFLTAEFVEHLRERVAFLKRARIQVVAPRFLLEQLAPEIDR